jgi:hypothetical protein
LSTACLSKIAHFASHNQIERDPPPIAVADEQGNLLLQFTCAGIEDDALEPAS